jgi:outer membrane murein-binding lipoprotein Lpp
MKKTRILLVASSLVILSSLILVGCGVPQEDYEELLAQKTALEAENKTLQSQYDSLQNEKEALEAEKDTLEAENQILEADYEQLSTNYNTLEADFETLQSEKNSLQAQYATVSNDLTEIQQVYPPRNFSSRRELEDWLLANDVSEKPVTPDVEAWIGRALEVQEDALADGYVVSMDYDGPDEEGYYWVFCTTVINGSIYYWDPETDEIWQDTSLGTVE